MTILLVRHGQTTFNAEGRLQGRVDAPLTELGRVQAKAMGRLVRRIILEEPGAWRLVSSPLGRARETAAHIAAATGLEVELDARVAEVSFGPWDGRLREELLAAYPQARGPGAHLFVSPEAESYDAVRTRLASFLEEQASSRGEALVVVSHGVAGRVLRGIYAGLSRDEALALQAPQDALFRLMAGAVERLEPDQSLSRTAASATPAAAPSRKAPAM